MKNRLLLSLAFFVFQGLTQEDDLLDELDVTPQKSYVSASFKNSRVINVQSMETVSEGVLDFRISHRFGRLNGGVYEFFGLDDAGMRLAFEYGITDRLSVGVGRTGFEKTYDGSLKYKLLWQTAGSNEMPISLVLYSSTSYNTLRYTGLPYERTYDTRLNYMHQLVIGRKFNKKVTLELLPTMVHRNFVETATESNTVYALAGAGRYKLTNRLAINAEYIYVPDGQLAPTYTNSFSIGFDIETGGHVFQLHLTNSRQMLDKSFVTETDGQWLNGDVHFGFNISRVFTVKERRLPKE